MMRTPGLTALALAAALGLATPAAAQTKLLIGATSASSSQYGYFVAVSQLINDTVDGADSAVVETGATVDNLRRIARDQIDLGLVTTNVGYHAATGQGDFAGRPVDSRLMWVYSVAPQNVIVRADSGVDSIAGLAGQRFNPGLKGSATEKTAEAVLTVLGVQPDYVRGSTTDIVDAVKDNRAIGYVKSGVGNKLDGSTLDIATMTPVRVLSLTPEQRKTIETVLPDLSVLDIPAGAADGVPAYTTWSFGLAVHARPGLSDDLAYAIAKAAFEDTTAQAAALSSMKGADLVALTLENGTVPLHPGVARYLKERGVTIPAKLMPKG